jgi:hypothetical protein
MFTTFHLHFQTSTTIAKPLPNNYTSKTTIFKSKSNHNPKNKNQKQLEKEKANHHHRNHRTKPPTTKKIKGT